MSSTIGLDIGTSAVRAVQIHSGGRGPATLRRVGQVMLPAGAMRDGEVVEPDVVADCVRQLWSRFGFKGRKVALGIANQQVVVRQVELPWLPDGELRQSLQYQAQDYIPIPLDQAVLDYHVLDSYENGEGHRMNRLLLVAAQRAMVDGVMEAVRLAKLEPVLLDLAAFAVLRSLAPERILDGAAGELLVDVGAAVTNVVVHEAGLPRFVRILLMGGAAITESLMTALGLPQDEAEQAKAAIGLGAGDSAAGDDTARLIGDRAARFVDEIRGSLDYYRSQPDAIPVRRVVLSGGASQLPFLRERLAEALRIPVDRGHPMQELRIGKVGLGMDDLVEAEPYLAVPVGLALGAVR